MRAILAWVKRQFDRIFYQHFPSKRFCLSENSILRIQRTQRALVYFSLIFFLLGSTDPSIDVICLMRILYYLNSNWGKYVGLPTCGPVISHLEFINSKLTAKATRQLQDPLVIMTGNLPPWLPELAKVWYVLSRHFFKVNKGNPRTICEFCSGLIIKTPKRCQ